MTTQKYLYIHDWRVHQSYRADRGMPPWIKIHRELLRSQKWLSLSESERGQLVSIWILAADHDGRIINDASIIRRACGLDSDPDLNKLISLGLLDAKLTTKNANLDANVTTINAILDAPEAETETETEVEAEKKESLVVSKKNNRQIYHPDFENLWIVWKHHKTPKGVKAEAFREWEKANLPDAANVEAKATAYCQQCAETDTNTKHVVRWIKYRGWEQDYDPPSNNGAKAMDAIMEWARREDEKDESNTTGNNGGGDRAIGNQFPVQVEPGD